jgi:hypothetical protein
MKRFQFLWQGAALAAVAIVSLVNLASMALRVPPPPVPVPGARVDDPATRQEQRLADVRRELRARNIRGVIGYLADRPADQVRQEAAGTEDYYLAQFVLLPVVLDLNAAAREWAVANWRKSPVTPPAGWKVEKDFGAGVFLLRREAR